MEKEIKKILEQAKLQILEIVRKTFELLVPLLVQKLLGKIPFVSDMVINYFKKNIKF